MSDDLKITITLAHEDDEALIRHLASGGRQGARRMRHLARVGLAATRLGVVVAADEDQRLILLFRRQGALVDLETLIDPCTTPLLDSEDLRHEPREQDEPPNSADQTSPGWLGLDLDKL